jgi:PAS domain S-box-containing protein
MNDCEKSRDELLTELQELKHEHISLKKAYLEDISEQNNSEKALKQSFQNFKTFFNSIGDFLFVLDVKGNILYANHTVYQRLGYTKEELIGQSVLIVHPLDKREEAGRIVGEMFTGKSESCPIIFITKSGIQIHVETILDFGEWDGKPAIFSVSKDISQIKFSEEKFSKIFHLNPSPCGLSDYETDKYFEVNEAFYEFFGFNKDEVLGNTPIELGIFNNESNLELIRKADKNGKIINATVELRTKRGDLKHVLLSAENINIQNKFYRFTLLNDMTEIIQTKKYLTELAIRNQTLLQTASDGIHVLDTKGNVIEANLSFCKMLGYSYDEVLKLNVSDWDMLWSGDELIRKVNENIASPAIYETKHRCKDGTILNVEINGIGVELNGKKYLYAAARNISERKQSESKIIEMQMMLNQVINLLPVRVFWKDNNLNYLGCNKIFAKDAGKNYSYELIGKDDYQMSWKEQAELYRADDRKVIDLGISKLNFEEPQTTPDGKIIWLKTSKVPLTDLNDNIIGILGVYEDITESKLVQEEIRKSEDKFRTYIKSSPLGIFIIDGFGNCIEVNKAGEKLLGYNAEEIKKIKLLHIVAESSREKAMIDFQNARENELIENELMSLRKDGSEFWAYINSVKLSDNSIIAYVQDITTRKKAEESLLRSEEQFKNLYNQFDAILDHIPGLVFYKDKKNNFIHVNKYVAQAHNKSKKELEGKNLSEIYPKEDADIYYQDDLSVINSGIAKLNIEEFWETNEGRKWVSTSKIPFIDISGEINGIIGMSIDITERKKAEEALKLLNNYNRNLIEVSLDPIVTINHEGRISDVNKATELVTGYSRQDLIGSDFSNYFTNPELAREGYRQVFKDGSVRDYPLEICNKNGLITHVLYNATVYTDNNLNVLGVFASARDISEHKKNEEVLRMNELKFRTVADYTYNWEYWEGKDNQLLYMTPSCERVCGYKSQEFLNDSALLKKIIHPDDANIFNNHFEKSHNLETLHNVDEIEFRIINKNGTIIQIGHLCRPVYDENNNYFGRRVCNRDITQQKIAEDEIKNKNIELSELNSSKDKFFSIIAHDLKSPFNGFLGLTKIMAEDIEDLSMREMQEFSISMQKSADNLYKLLENLLEWSRIQRGLTIFNPEICRLILIVKNILEVHSEVAKQKEILLINRIHEDTTVFTDLPMLNTILRNLITNALKFTERGGKVEIGEVISSDDFIEIFVKDNGIGIDEDTKSKLFKIDQNVSRPGTEKEPSTGLGLILCKEFVEKHGGNIWVDSEEGIGSTFYFTLPKKIVEL